MIVALRAWDVVTQPRLGVDKVTVTECWHGSRRSALEHEGAEKKLGD